jgi:hypothetical protein
LESQFCYRSCLFHGGNHYGRVPLCIPAALAASTAIWLSLRKTVSDWAEAAEAGVGPELAI